MNVYYQWVHCRSMYYGRKLDDVIPIKDVWKWVNGPKLAEILSVPVEQKVNTAITVFILNIDARYCEFHFNTKISEVVTVAQLIL